MTQQAHILVINAGSSSVKFAVYATDLTMTLQGQISDIGTIPHLRATDAGGQVLNDKTWEERPDAKVHDLIGGLISWLEAQMRGERLIAVGHRVAIGGLEHSAPLLVSGDVLAKLQDLVPLAPLHQPRNLEPIRAFAALHPDLPQIACFDTAFHRTLPNVATLYGLPRALARKGAVRYGFHGLSYEYIGSRLPSLDSRAAEGRTVVAHLGSGASMCAMRGGKSIATTMGFSPLSGLIMATRPGELDAGLVLWLMRSTGMSIDAVEHFFYHDCGLKGVSGLTGDMQSLIESEDPHAHEAVDLFTYRVSAELGRLCAALGGIDALVFTGGIGENAPGIRSDVCSQAAWLGVNLDESANRQGAMKISAKDSSVSVWAVPTNEELMIARHTLRIAVVTDHADLARAH
jgi:acetate kinase